MPRLNHILATALLGATLWAATPAQAQGGDGGHDTHHPGSAASAAPESASSRDESDPMARMPAPLDAPAASSAGGGAGSAPGCCGGGADAPLYPSLINLAALTPAQRSAYEARARAGVTEGAARLQRGHEQLGLAVATGDLGASQRALAQLRADLGGLEGGLATYAMLAAPVPPRQVALDWFRRDMGLEQAPAVAPHGLFGLTTFHYVAMLALAALAAMLLWMLRQRARRTQALVTRLGSEPVASAGTAPLPAARAAQPGPVTDGPLRPAPAVPAPLSREPTPANAWSGVLQVAAVFQETAQVKTFRLLSPGGEPLPFAFLPGQFLTLSVAPGGRAVRRSYTISSAPTQRDYCEITVRHEEHGVVSGFLHAQVEPGALLQVTAPAGRFTFTGEEADGVVLIAGGVGITPMMSVVRYLTDRCWPGRIDLVYGCRADDDVIFRDELERLAHRHPNLRLTLVANHAQATAWPYRTGRITRELLAEAVPQLASRRIHLCGPAPMMEAVKQALAELGVPPQNVRTEAFIGKERPVAPQPPREVAATPTGTPTATFARSGKRASLTPDKTLLEAAEEVGVSIDYACRAGTCGTCRVKLLAGDVTMEVEEGLEPGDREQRIVLACEAKSRADVIVDA